MRNPVSGRASASRPVWCCALAAAATTLLIGCSSPVGNGVGPIALSLAAATGTDVTVQGVTRVYQCFQGGVTATLFFSDGTAGNFTNRVKWSSSNEGVVRVSNGDIAASDGSGIYAAGTLIPGTAGSSIVTAEYASIKAQLQVSVGVPSSFTIRQTLQSVAVPVTDLSLGVGTTQAFTVAAVTDGVERDVSAFAKWTIGGATASVTSTGLVTALGAGISTPLTASFLNCENTASTNVTVANITGIEIVPEFGSDPLIQSNSEKMNVLADLDNGAKQDVSLQSVLTSTDTSVASFVIDSTASNVLQPITTGPVTVQATLNNTYTAADVSVNIITSTLTDLTISPASAVLRANSDELAYFKATGKFLNGQTQDFTRSVTWAVTDPTLAGISNGKGSAGFAAPGTVLVGSTTVTATPVTTDSTATVTSAALIVDSVANPATPPPSP